MAGISQGQKLIVTIVKKAKAKKIIHASKEAGARGGTTLIGDGYRLNEKRRVLGIPVERQREIILTLVSDRIFPKVMGAIIQSVHLDKPRQGIGFVINTSKITGIRPRTGHDIGNEAVDKGDMHYKMEKQDTLYDLVVTIVNKGDSEKVIDATKKAGAEGGTILNGRGTGIHEKAKLFNILIEPEKEVVLTLITRDKTNDVLQAVEDEAEINKPGKGIAFVMEVDQTVGISHLHYPPAE